MLQYYKQKGLAEPHANNLYSDFITDFITDCIVKDENGSAKLEDTYKRFKDWWKDSQTGKAPNRKDMKISLENNGYQYHRENHWDDEYIGK